VAIIVALAGLGGYYFLGQANEARISTAKIQTKTLTQACETYSLNHNGQWPPSLVTLLGGDEKGSPPILKSKDALIDPWGNEYGYDPSGAENRAVGNIGQPDIWAVAPDGRKIGNWMK
jgi:type II secretory pathway pseudopilin PulG